MADAIETRRRQLRIAKGQMAELAGVNRETLRPVRAGLLRDYNDETIFGLARALRWPVDWYERLKRGEPAVDENGEADPRVSDRLDDLERRADELERLLREVLRRLEERP